MRFFPGLTRTLVSTVKEAKTPPSPSDTSQDEPRQGGMLRCEHWRIPALEDTLHRN